MFDEIIIIQHLHTQTIRLENGFKWHTHAQSEKREICIFSTLSNSQQQPKILGIQFQKKKKL